MKNKNYQDVIIQQIANSSAGLTSAQLRKVITDKEACIPCVLSRLLREGILKVAEKRAHTGGKIYLIKNLP